MNVVMFQEYMCLRPTETNEYLCYVMLVRTRLLKEGGYMQRTIRHHHYTLPRSPIHYGRNIHGKA